MIIRTTIAAAGLLALTSGAFAQTVIFEPEQEVVVREYVVKQPRGEVVLPEDYDIIIGEPLPETVTVRPLDAPGFDVEYEYVVVDGQTLIVEPGTRRVVQVLR